LQRSEGLIVRRRGGHIGVIAGLGSIVEFDATDITIITRVDPVAVRLQRIEDIAEIGYRLRARTATAIPIELVILPATFALGAVLALPLVAGLLDALLEFFFRLFLVLLELRVIELLGVLVLEVWHLVVDCSVEAEFEVVARPEGANLVAIRADLLAR